MPATFSRSVACRNAYKECKEVAPAELIRGAVRVVKQFAAGAEQSDDITALAIQYRLS